MSQFTIHVPESDPLKRYCIAKFNPNLNVDVSTWNQKDVKMKREDNRSHVLTNVIEQDYGEGSEYGRAAREEARRKKYGRMAKTYSIDKQPWLLNVKDPATGKEKKYKSIVDRTGEHADYWIFVKTGKDKFHAHKVNEWYQFLPQVAHKVLDIDQAEEQFQQRSKVMNQFALKAQIQQQLKDADREDGGKTVRGSNLLVKDEASSDEDGSGGSDADEKREKKKKKPGMKGKDKRVRVQHGEEVAKYESDDGDDDGMEFDYMTDSGSDSELVLLLLS
uniref:Transcription initiation factor IIF subunit alpha n=1 Tax=Panagrolaimus sp. JU765 TaxID=591449 RepID=A0AC34R7C7_9BILA